MRGVVDNPFLPGSDAVPQVWAGRERELAEARDVVAPRRLGGLHERGRAVLGEFGIGKSVLVNRLAEEGRAAGHWVAPAVRVPLGVEPVGLLLAALGVLADSVDLPGGHEESAGRLARRVEELTLPVVGGGVRLTPAADGGTPPHVVLRDLLVELASAARTATSPEAPDGRLVVVRLDEVQNVRGAAALSQLLTALGDALEATTEEVDVVGIRRRRALPLAVYLSGLPDLSRLAAAAGATFSRRFRVWELDPLSEPELRVALLPFTTSGWPVLTADGPRTVHLEPAAVDALVEVCLGDPFLFQLAGEAAWNAGPGPVITAEEVRRGWAGARREVARYVAARLEGLTDLQLSYLQAAAALGPEERTSAAVALALGRRGSAALGVDGGRPGRRPRAAAATGGSDLLPVGRRGGLPAGAPGPDRAQRSPSCASQPRSGSGSGSRSRARRTAGCTTSPSPTFSEPASRSCAGSRSSRAR